MRILVTAGPTREFFDSVRFLSNPSSGRMGYAIAAEAGKRGHEVALVSGPVQLTEPKGVRVIHVVSAQEMLDAAVSLFDECHAAVMTAAVSDYRPSQRFDHKLKRRQRTWTVQLEPTEDICAHLGSVKGNRVVVGFAMEDHDHHASAERKLREKHCDAIVLNEAQTAGLETAEVGILRADAGWSAPRAGTKAEIAVLVVDLVEALVGAGS